ncbi:LemA family protein [Pseudemcibacter aquimaris]|uniref:LemA family protein n=1 Tax=Pseudemcibacter aquimaris TaxID=2857064 RepID=UPI002013288C|nr:LemA family protein [Pseudemcibacter aquimaris]MCC3860287.1 LemA family protein [Pseudemcibacter aquimaris]WDU57612.1 LemA family protein [Pseudemcibacter aquimaris]
MELLIGLGVIGVIFYILYVRLIKLKNGTLEALSSIDVQLKKRHDLVPNILTIAKKFMEHEEAVLTKVTQMRTISGSDYDKNNPDEVAQHLEANKQLQSAMMNLFAVAENYPDLKSQETMVRAQETYEEVEGHISAARRFYNSSVTDLKNAVEIFPSSMVASMIGVKAMPFFEIDEAEREPVNAADIL